MKDVSNSRKTDIVISGYVALAVATEGRTVSKEIDTGYGPERQANMLAFAVSALTLAKDVIANKNM